MSPGVFRYVLVEDKCCFFNCGTLHFTFRGESRGLDLRGYPWDMPINVSALRGCNVH